MTRAKLWIFEKANQRAATLTSTSQPSPSPPQRVRVNAVLSRVLGHHDTEVNQCNRHFHCLSVVVWSSSTLWKTVGWSLHRVCCVRCCETSIFPHTTQVAPPPHPVPLELCWLWVCVVVGVNIVSLFIVKVCPLPHNTMGFPPWLLVLIV